MGYPYMSSRKPNPGHIALAEMQHHGLISTHITQNVDSLLNTAGCPSVLELHGTLASVSCLKCNDKHSRADFQKRLMLLNRDWAQAVAAERVSTLARPDGDYYLTPEQIAQFEHPDCHHCNHFYMPDITFFGGAVPKEVSNRATEIVNECSRLLIVGSTVATYSAFRLVQMCVGKGVPVMVLTFGETRADPLLEPDHKIDTAIPETLAAVKELLLTNRVAQ
eukprot:c15134_g1_i4.p1 GENE.c15134_g1_i4~~c15134_g1_i4.p1  ORF type:complete len:221 (+),score=42.15 c15134_g1_i4:198-860(+)